MDISVSSESGVVDILVDATDTADAAGGDADVARLTPAGAPGVADDVVLSAVFFTPTDGSDSVVNVGRAAVSGGDDTTRIVHEDVIASGNSDVDGLLV